MTINVAEQASFIAQTSLERTVAEQSAYLLINSINITVAEQSAFIAFFPGKRITVSEQSSFIALISIIPLNGLKQKRIVNINIG
jgi:hypothetical protein